MKLWTLLRRAAGGWAALATLLAMTALAEPTNALSDAEIQGRQLARQLVAQMPATNWVQSGTISFRDEKGNRTAFPFQYEVRLGLHYNTTFEWFGKYTAFRETDGHTAVENAARGIHGESLFISFGASHPNIYKFHLADHQESSSFNSTGDLLTPFAGTDFWACDLGLEFFHWPTQKVLPKTTNLKRGREYTLLESTDPNPNTNGYSRVLSWIDQENGGILAAEAYDAAGKKLKEFEPKTFKKVNGQWELQEMEIRNVQTHSRTRLEFDLKKTE